MKLRLSTFVITVLCLIVLAMPLQAQTHTSGSSVKPVPSAASTKAKNFTISDRLANWRGTLLSTEQALSRSGISENELAEKSRETLSLRRDVLKLERELAPLISLSRERLNELGPAPSEAEPKETEEIAGNRLQLEGEFSRLDGEFKAARLIAVRAAQIEQQIINHRRDRFISQISQRSNSLFDFQLWDAFWSGLEGLRARFSLLISESVSAMKTKIGQSNLLAPVLWGALVLISIVFVALRNFFQNRLNKITADSGSGPLDHYTKVRLAAISFIRTGLVPIGVLLTLLFLFSTVDIFSARLANLSFEFTSALAMVIGALSLTRVYLRPQLPSHRIANLSDQVAVKISRIILVGVLLAALLRLANITAVRLVSPFEVTIALSALFALTCFIAVFLILVTTASNADAIPAQITIRRNFIRWGYINPLYWLTIFGGVFSLVIGYIAFAEFLAWQILISATLFALLWLCIELLDLHRDRYLDVDSGRWRQLSRATGFTRQTVLQGSVFGFGLAKLLVIAAAATTFLISWGYRTGDWAGPIAEAFFGFNIGGLSISFSAIALAVILFIGGYLITRAIQFWLRNQFLPTTSLDPGLRNSIATVFGYTGIVLAVVLAITAAGLDLSNVAIVAGALSVGIGFGLQSIVNNFVSGLILLAERPIKAGDWIITGVGEGTVRKTSVRSTEIETFDGATVIIPNSTLITDAVTNWTHHDQKGRIKIAIGVGYDSDPDEVSDILLECGQSHEKVVNNPAPVVYFMDFGADALIFELRAYLADINSCLSVQSDLRFAIVKALRKADIEIPFPQRDIHIKSAPGEFPTTKSVAKKPPRRKTGTLPTKSNQG